MTVSCVLQEDDLKTLTARVLEAVPPEVLSVSPADGTKNTGTNATIHVRFSETIEPSTISEATLTITTGDTPIAGTLSVNEGLVHFNPKELLSASTKYTGLISNGVTDLAGNPLLLAYSWSFQTGISTDDQAPRVTSVSPQNNATGVSLNQVPVLSFSEALDVSRVTKESFFMSAGEERLSGEVRVLNSVAMFRPSESLSPETNYTMTVTTDILDTAGNALAGNETWSFTTGTENDTTVPVIIANTPSNGSTNNPVNRSIGVTFSETMDASTLTTNQFKVSDGTGNIAGTVHYLGKVATFTPSFDLDIGTVFTVTLTKAVKDSAGNGFPVDNIWSFTTGLDDRGDTEAPVIVSTIPTGGETAVSINTPIKLTFSEAMDVATLTLNTVTVSKGIHPIEGTLEVGGTTVTFIPNAPLTGNTSYQVSLLTDVSDSAGNPMTENYMWSFTTGSESP